jgi:hypothetical protein
MLAGVKPLWYDEIFTSYVSQFSTLDEFWAGLACDNNPPLYYLLTHLCVAGFGPSPLALRLPSMIGFWVLCLCLYRFVAGRSLAPVAWVAALFPIATYAYDYAFEARPYGVLLGCGGLALLGYQSMTERDNRTTAFLFLTLSLAAAVSTHYYAVLLWIPLGLAELVRSRTRRRVDLPVWLALVLGLTPLLFYLPLIEQAKAYSSGFWAKPSWALLPATYVHLLERTLLPFVGVLIALALAPALTDTRRDVADRPGGRFSSHEAALAIGLTLLPLFALLLGFGVTGVYHTRYVLPTVIGFAILLALVTSYHARDAGGVAIILAGILAVWQLLAPAGHYLRVAVEAAKLRTHIEFLTRHAQEGTPIAVADPLAYLQLAHHAPPALASRLVYASSPTESLRFKGNDTSERALRVLRDRTGLPIHDFETFVADTPEFRVYGDGWLLPALQAHKSHRVAKVLGTCQETRLVLVRATNTNGP